ncbi:NUDIX domain-containing protein [Candidatus Saccharibacteria bacterium]|nr:NUDIX domain-containing protein [Candidatus Saccharibacteria bacterium]
MPHIHEKYDFTVAAFIVYRAKVLLVNHPRYGMWLPPGGHIELDEDPDEALRREIKEETGLENVEILSPKPSFSDAGRKALFTPHYLDVHEANPPHRHIALVYFGRTADNKHIKSDEHTEVEWFSVAELEKSKYKIPSDIIFYSKEAIKLAQNT